MNWTSRIIAGIDPLANESPYGYLLRVSETYQYRYCRWLLDLTGLDNAADLHRPRYAGRVAQCLRITEEEWAHLSYQETGSPGEFKKRRFRGQLLDAVHINMSSPRICPACIEKAEFCRAEWDIALVSTCPLHNCLLVNTCWKCKNKLRWNRKGIRHCKCGADLCSSVLIAADPTLTAANACLYASAGPNTPTLSVLLQTAAFPSQFLHLNLNSLLKIFLLLGNLGKQTPDSIRKFSAISVSPAVEIGHAAGLTASNWPHGLLALLKVFSHRISIDECMRASGLLGRHQHAWLRVLNDPQFSFVRQVYESFLAEEWHGPLHPQMLISPSVHKRSQYISLGPAARMAKMRPETLGSILRRGELHGFIREGRQELRGECWIQRSSLQQWLGKRAAAERDYLPCRRAQTALGLSRASLLHLVTAKLIRCEIGPRHGLPPGVHFDRDEIESVVRWFENSCIPKHVVKKHEELILFSDALRLYLGRRGLVHFFAKVREREISPKGHDESIPGVGGYLFSISDVKQLRSWTYTYSAPEGTITFHEAAKRIGTTVEVIRNLVEEKALSACTHLGPRGQRLLPITEVEKFSKQFTSLSSLAHSNRTSNRSLLKRLDSKSILRIGLPGKGVKLFVAFEQRH